MRSWAFLVSSVMLRMLKRVSAWANHASASVGSYCPISKGLRAATVGVELSSASLMAG